VASVPRALLHTREATRMQGPETWLVPQLAFDLSALPSGWHRSAGDCTTARDCKRLRVVDVEAE
jgi:hypothetical protein